MTIQHFQILCGLCWLVPVLIYLPALFRVLFTRRWLGIDAPRVVVWFMGLNQLCFVGRWIAWPDATHVMVPGELGVWSGLYVFSSLCSLCFVYVLHARAKAKK
jgi:hypothetical protein